MLKDINEQTISKLITDAVETLGAENIVNGALKYVDAESLREQESVTTEMLEHTFTVAGFMYGIDFTLRNLDAKDE